MTNAETHVLIFKDQTGDYYLLPQETLERGRVPADHRAEVERLVAEAEDARSMGGDDTHGYLASPGPTFYQYHRLMIAKAEQIQQGLPFPVIPPDLLHPLG